MDSENKENEKPNFYDKIIEGDLEFVKSNFDTEYFEKTRYDSISFAAKSDQEDILSFFINMSSRWPFETKKFHKNLRFFGEDNSHAKGLFLLMPIIQDDKELLATIAENACTHGSLDVLSVLDPYIDFKKHALDALFLASDSNHLDVVNFLIPRADKNRRNNEGLMVASANKNSDIFNALYDPDTAQETLSFMKKNKNKMNFSSEDFKMLEERVNVIKSKEELTKSVSHVTAPVRPRSKI